MNESDNKSGFSQKEAAGRVLSLAAEKIGAALFVRDPGGRYIYANSLFCRIAGLEPDEVIGSGDELNPPALFTDKEFSRVLEGERVAVSVSPAGEEEGSSFDFILEPLTSPEGVVEGIAGIGQREERGIRISPDLIRSRDAEEARVILSRVAHDLNNYLYGVTGVAALALESAPEDKSVRSDLREILEISEKTGNYIKKLQERAQEKMGKGKRESLKDILSGIEGYIRKEFPGRIRVRTVLPEEDCPARVEREKIENAILNICFNARDAIEDKGEIVLRLNGLVRITESREGKYYRIVIEDSGRGMDPEEKKKCLQLFYTTGKNESSLGIGLPVAESIIRKHHGELSVNTSPGRGTSVEILLPAV